MLEPHLPRTDPEPRLRAVQLEQARATYRYSYQWPPGVAVAAEVPRSDTYSLGYIAELLPSAWEIFKNTLAMVEVVREHEGLRLLFEREVKRIPTLEASSVGDWYLRVATDISSYVAQRAPESIAGYGELYRGIEKPQVWSSWEDDRTFVWQRVAGVNPMPLERVRAIPGNVAIGERERARTIPTGSLAAALAEGRLFACDYAVLDGAPTGSTNGIAKHLPAPYALFEAVGGTLQPIAIQIGQAPGSVVATPADAHPWRVAKLAVQVADANHHETFSHLGRTHLVMEAVTLAMRRQLSERHPLHRLLVPHVEFTLPINHSAATNLIAPGGAVDKAFAGTIEASAALVRRGIESFDLRHAAPPVDLASRGLDDSDVLREHPYRDDAVLVFGAIHRFVERYVRLYYAADADVAADVELAAFVTELGAEDGGRIRGATVPGTVDELITLVANVVWLATGQHAAVNFPQYPYMGVVPNMSGAMWGEWPPKDPGNEATLLSQLPPYDVALLALHTVYQLSSVRVNHLGKYGIAHFLDPRARAAVSALQSDLADVEAVIAAREPSRHLPYPHLLPSRIPNSIHI